ncbi:MAG: bifunctional glycosyltransferase family 2/GtrA family protein [Clostridia bacterium]|nr:bifunctional glycosyltransferase family 2/GtrA family protein [Clostridia bacterium]
MSQVQPRFAVLIPAYKPSLELIQLVKALLQYPDLVPVVVDDGSGEDFAPVFAALPDCITLLRHEVNRGKGAALKTGFAYIAAHMPHLFGVVTADADGQHRTEDILRVCECLQQHPEALVLGSRLFTGNVPFRSRFGNVLTRWVFRWSTGGRVSDTQTGLRAVTLTQIPRLLEHRGERYEYEINMIIDFARAKLPIREVPIETVYINNNESSHFNPIVDSLKIYACLLKFCLSSFIAFAVDYALVLLLSFFMKPAWGEELGLAVAVVLARVASGTINFLFNKLVVFRDHGHTASKALRYLILAVLILGLNYGLLYVLNILLPIPLPVAKLLADLLLFFFSYAMQKKVVFR